MYQVSLMFFFFFFKQKTSYEMRISDWSSDVCSSDLLGVPYEVHTIDITKDEQFSQDFLAINPNNKIPAIIDPDGPGDATFTLFESGAILIYLAKKHQSPLWPDDPLLQARVLQWLMFQMGG